MSDTVARSPGELGFTGLRIRWGRLWFQYRSFSPLPLLILILFLPPFVLLSTEQHLLFVGFMLLAELIRIWAVGYAGSVTRTRGDEVGNLVHAGPFRHVRNPLYLANILLYVSCGALFGLGPYCILVFLFFAAQYSLIVSYEESVLRRSFGPAYLNYCRHVPRWIPRLRPQVPASPHPFSLRKALRSERSTLLAFVAVLVVFLFKSLSS